MTDTICLYVNLCQIGVIESLLYFLFLDYGVEKNVSLADKNPSEVLTSLEVLAKNQ